MVTNGNEGAMTSDLGARQTERQFLGDDKVISNQLMVSVTIPFLNPGKYFEATIRSVFAQTYKNWELLLLDDG